MSRQPFLDSSAPHGDRSAHLREAIEKAEQHFQELSEEDQVLSLLATKISFVYGQVDDDTRDKAEVARQIISSSHGPKYAGRVLADPESRKKLGLDRPVRPSDPSVIAKTVVHD